MEIEAEAKQEPNPKSASKALQLGKDGGKDATLKPGAQHLPPTKLKL